jgi:hypothetical protein
MAGSIEYSQSVAIGTRGGAGTKLLQAVTCGIGKTGQIIQKEGVRGSRSRHSGTCNTGPYTVGGPLSVQPSPDELRVLLPYILGTAESGSGTSGTPWSYALANTLSAMRVSQDLRPNATGSDNMVFHWDGLKVASCRIGSSAGSQLLTFDLDMQGTTETVNATWPSIASTLTTDKPFIHAQLVLSLNSSNRAVDNFSISIDNGLILDRMLNSLYRTEIPEADRVITLECDNPFTATDLALYDIAVAGIAGVATFTNGSSILTFTFANLKAPAQAIQRAQRGEAMNKLTFTAYETGTAGSTTKELVTTLSTS